MAYAGDVAEGVMTLIDQEEVFESVIGSGEAYSIENWLDECFNLVNIDWKHYVVKRENFKSEYKILVSNPSTINSLGWHASTTISELAKLMIDHRADTII